LEIIADERKTIPPKTFKVLFLIGRDFLNPYIAGGDIYCNEFAKRLAAKGHKVYIIAHGFHNASPIALSNGIIIFRIGGLFSPLRAFKLYLRYFYRNVDIVVEEVIGGRRLPYFARLYVRENLFAIWYQRNKPISLLTLLEYLLVAIYKTTPTIVTSFRTALDLSRLGFRNVKVVYPVIDFRCSRNAPYSERDLILFVGVLRKYKCPHHIIQAFKLINNRLPSYKLVIAGRISDFDKKYVGYLISLIKKLKLTKRVSLEINVTQTRKKELIEKALCLVVPSPIEGFSMITIEAGRCGTPVIASDGVPEDVVIDMFNGIRYHFGDVNELAEKIYELTMNRDLWQKLSQNSIRWSYKFREKDSIEKIERIFKRVSHIE
jgi:glycosyltransferase involved in cell wall biosynthesis